MTVRRTLFCLCLFALAAALAPASASAAPGRYIVVLKENADSAEVADQHGRRYGAQLSNVYRDALKGYAATIPEQRVDDVRGDDRVDYVEADKKARAVAQTLPWGIDRVGADTSSTLAGNGSGTVSNVHAYVLDTGIYRHSDLNVANHVNYTTGTNADCHGHGTHVAGTLAARDNSSYVVGVAPGAPLTGVKVLGCDASGSYSWIIAGIDYVTRNAPNTAGPDVANMSLGGSTSQAVDDAVRRSAASGVFYALAAGNNGRNACNYSPSRAGAGTNNGIATVAATDSSNREASWSNYGSCVDLWAPGVSVLSTSRSGGTTTMSGTSMASPHTAGGGALYRSRYAATPSDVESKLKASARTSSYDSKDGRSIRGLYVGGSAGF